VPKRVAYVCTVERLRKWDGLDDATKLGLQFDLVIVDEAHVFRNSDTKSHALGAHLSQWADALVFPPRPR
jgi:superfamily II DNA or RNA helicase